MSATHNALHSTDAQTHCPCCGQPMPVSDGLVLDDVMNRLQFGPLTMLLEPLKFRIVDRLATAKPGFVDTYDLLESAFHRTASEMDAMPYAKASMLVKVQMTQLRKRLQQMGLDVQSKGRRPTLYRLVELSQQVAA
ncbi:MAG: hypothetical protein AAF903_12145 [Pseudomonadota bacterium]